MRKLIFISTLFLMPFLGCRQTSSTLFNKIDADHSGLHFSNTITESDTFNILTTEFIYNGSGVAIGDLNGDGLEDLFIAGNQVDNALYINKGNLQFEDVTHLAKAEKPNKQYWSSGVNVVDINLDGKLDIYVCNTLHKDSLLRKNLLYINQGNTTSNDLQVPTFVEMSEAYGVADESNSSHAQFFDYDNDGDLDLFVGVNLIEEKYPNAFVPLKSDGSDPNCDRLFQNNWDATLGHPVFTNVSFEAGLLYNGYSHSTLIHDFNEDGWQDIYVANDYESNDLIFINNQDGTFSNQADKIFKHFSLSAMGSDVGDVNNDGKADLFTSEMQPYYNKRKKLFQGASSYQREINTRRFNYTFQYTRNTLQVMLGTNPETNLPIYGEVGMHAGVQETDWSWASLFADYDNDGFQDLYIANGFPKDVTDRDFSDYRAMASSLVDQEQLIAAIPEVKSPNQMFRNKGELQFEEVGKEWGVDVPSFSNGAAYADLDNDGDVDLVVNNINDPILLFENTSNPSTAVDNNTLTNRNYLRIKLKGAERNPDAFGAAVEVFKNDWHQKSFLVSGRGYLSKSESTLHFGLGDFTKVDSIKIIWPGGFRQMIGETEANQVVEVNFAKAEKESIAKKSSNNTKGIYTEVAADYGLNYTSRDIDFIDFNFQRTLPHKFSQYGPSIAVGDINGDGLEDFFLASSRTFKERWFIQQADGQFSQEEVQYKNTPEAFEEDAGTLLFDADQDGDLDLYIARGSGQYKAGDVMYQDVLLLNDGKGKFTMSPTALPKLTANGSCVKAADFDRDGDLDLFVGSRVLPMAYPYPDRSYILRNETSNGEVKFVDATSEINEDLLKPGLINDALWTDFNNDFWPDLILGGEWMPITIFENRKGKLVDITSTSGLDDYRGWWNSLASADLDNDGDLDYVGGNFGENLYFQCSSDEPLRVYGKDLDNNGSIDPLISCFWKDSLGNKAEYLYHPLQDVIKQFVSIRKKYNSFGAFGDATVAEMFEPQDLENNLILTSNWMKSSWIENLGNGKFEIHELPLEAQLAPIYGMRPMDYNGDGFLDLLLVGNDFGMEVQQGRADAFVGLLLENNGEGDFIALSLDESQFFVPGDAKSLVQLNLGNQSTLYLASQNNGDLKVFSESKNEKIIKLDQAEVSVLINFKNGSKRIQDFYWGDSFQSQSGRFIRLNAAIKELIVYDQMGKETRRINSTIQ